MAITAKRPPRKETVGSQYICFNKGSNGEWSETFDEEVEKTSVVKSVKVSENSETTDVYASGEVYDSETTSGATQIEVEVVAFDVDTLAKMRGDKVGENGSIIKGGNGTRPYFAYGKVVKLKGGKVRFEWYPKCKLAENSDEVSTREDKSAEMNDTITINAYAFEPDGGKCLVVDTSSKKYPAGVTEEKFFAKPILKDADLTTMNAMAMASVREEPKASE